MYKPRRCLQAAVALARAAITVEAVVDSAPRIAQEVIAATPPSLSSMSTTAVQTTTATTTTVAAGAAAATATRPAAATAASANRAQRGVEKWVKGAGLASQSSPNAAAASVWNSVRAALTTEERRKCASVTTPLSWPCRRCCQVCGTTLHSQSPLASILFIAVDTRLTPLSKQAVLPLEVLGIKLDGQKGWHSPTIKEGDGLAC